MDVIVHSLVMVPYTGDSSFSGNDTKLLRGFTGLVEHDRMKYWAAVQECTAAADELLN